MSATTTVSVIGRVAFGRRSTSSLAVMCLAASRFVLKANRPNRLSLTFRLFMCIAAVGWGLGVGSAQVQVPVEFGPDGTVISPDLPQANPGATSIPGRYIIKFANGVSPAQRAAAARGVGAQVLHNFAFSSTTAIRVPSESALNGLRNSRSVLWIVPDQFLAFGVCTSLPTTPHLVVGRSACRVGVGPSLNRSWAQRSRPVVQAGRRAFPGDESVVD